MRRGTCLLSPVLPRHFLPKVEATISNPNADEPHTGPPSSVAQREEEEAAQAPLALSGSDGAQVLGG